MPDTSRDDVAPSRRARLHVARRRRARRRGTVAVAAVIALATALPAAGGTLPGVPEVAPPGAAAVDDAPPASGVPVVGPPPTGASGTLATVEDAESWCAYLSSFYLSFPSPWSARVINCRPSDLFVAPVYSDGTLGMCVLVPARHSRHLGGNVARWVTDIRLC